jgi:hypothetical protein
MPVSSAPIRSADRSAAARVLQPVAVPAAANDDCSARASDNTLDAALRHFAVHGLGAAQAAFAAAEEAWQRGDRHASGNWLAVCGMFDKRLAGDLEKRLTQQAAAIA